MNSTALLSQLDLEVVVAHLQRFFHPLVRSVVDTMRRREISSDSSSNGPSGVGVGPKRFGPRNLL